MKDHPSVTWFVDLMMSHIDFDAPFTVMPADIIIELASGTRVPSVGVVPANVMQHLVGPLPGHRLPIYRSIPVSA